MLLAVVPVANTLVHPIGKKVPSGTFLNIFAPKTPVVCALYRLALRLLLFFRLNLT